ncbi:FAD-dependent monooxygenase [Streptomyces polygonati]|uniref:FAD-dependent monooxygenase n=1 Tax=Streptomyces polygonati TaxID=1617087 RepID=A0ABV8HNG1_9ACTN
MAEQTNQDSGEPGVLIVGAGAAGLMLACDLLQQGVDVRVVDRRELLDNGDPHSRAVLIWPRMLELLHRIGIVDELVGLGFRITGVSYFSSGRRLGTVPMDTLGTARPYTLSLPQREIERVLRKRHEELGGRIELGLTLEELDNSGPLPVALLRHSSGAAEIVRPQWLVGADGVGSATRRLLGIGYPGNSFELGISIGDFPVSGPNGTHVEYHYSRFGLLPVIPMGSGVGRLASIVPPVGDGWQSLSRDQLQAIVDKRASLPYTIGEPKWIRTFQPRPGIAERFRDGRCLLVGDSAHCLVPLGGQGLNLGIQDVFNVSWKLAGVIQGRLRDSVLDSYDTERRVAARQVTAVVDKQILAARQVKRWPSLLRDTVMTLGRWAGLGRRLAAPLISQVGLAYGEPQTRSLLRPQPRRARPGQRVPFYPPSSPATARPALDLSRHMVLLWPGRRVRADWGSVRAAVSGAVGGRAPVHDLAELPAGERRQLLATFGGRPVLAVVRPDGHLAELSPVSRPGAVADFLRSLAPEAVNARSTSAAGPTSLASA